MSLRRITLASLAFASLLLSNAIARTWTNTEGKTVFATYVKLDEGTVHMRLNNGRVAKVPMAKLSAKDQAWVREKEAGNKAAPTGNKDAQRPVTPPAPPAKPKLPFKDLGSTNFPKLQALPPIPDDARIPVADWIGRRYFYMTKDGKDAFPHLTITNRVKPFSEGLAYIEIKKGKERDKGYIDRTGKFVIGGDSGTPLPEGSNFSDFSEGMASFRNGKFAGYFDKAGKLVIPANKYFGAEPFSEGVAMVCTDFRKEWKFIDKTGNIVLASKDKPWLGSRQFKNGAAWVTVAYGPYQSPIRILINRQGEKLLPDEYKTSSTSGSITNTYTSLEGSLYDTSGTKLIEESKLFYIYPHSERDPIGIIYGRNGQANRLIHIPTKTLFGPDLPKNLHGLYSYFSEGLMPFSSYDGKKSRYGWIDRRGKVVIKPEFFEAAPFIEGFAVLRKAYGPDNKDIRVVVINRKGEIVYKGEARK